MKDYKTGEIVRGFTQQNAIEYGIIEKVNKNSYKLRSGILIKKEGAELVSDSEIEQLVSESSAPSILLAFSKLQEKNIDVKKLEKAYAVLFGKKALDTLKNYVRNFLGF